MKRITFKQDKRFVGVEKFAYEDSREGIDTELADKYDVYVGDRLVGAFDQNRHQVLFDEYTLMIDAVDGVRKTVFRTFTGITKARGAVRVAMREARIA